MDIQTAVSAGFCHTIKSNSQFNISFPLPFLYLKSVGNF